VVHPREAFHFRRGGWCDRGRGKISHPFAGTAYRPSMEPGIAEFGNRLTQAPFQAFFLDNSWISVKIYQEPTESLFAFRTKKSVSVTAKGSWGFKIRLLWQKCDNKNGTQIFRAAYNTLAISVSFLSRHSSPSDNFWFPSPSNNCRFPRLSIGSVKRKQLVKFSQHAKKCKLCRPPA